MLFQNAIRFQTPQVKKLIEICPNITHLSVSGCHKLLGTLLLLMQSYTNIYADLTPLIDAYANTLVSLDCSRLFFSAEKLAGLTKLKKLERLILTGNSINNGELILNIAQACPNLKCLHLPSVKGNHLLQLHEYLPNLEELKLIDPIDLPFEEYHHLRRIEITCVSSIQSMHTVLQRLANLQHLEYVKLDGSRELDGALPLEFATNQRKLM